MVSFLHKQPFAHKHSSAFVKHSAVLLPASRGLVETWNTFFGSSRQRKIEERREMSTEGLPGYNRPLFSDTDVLLSQVSELSAELWSVCG